MTLLNSHVDRDLSTLAKGTLAPRKWRRAIQHARNCYRCAALYDQSIHVLRQLEHQSALIPSSAEVAAFTALNGPSVGTGAWRADRFIWFGSAAVAALAAGLALFVFVSDSTVSEFATRGGHAAASRGSLRIFCGGNDQPLVELRDARASCTVGQSLAFAVGSISSQGQVSVVVGGTAAARAQLTAAVTASVGSEESVALTVQLERPGDVEVVAAFGDDAHSSEAAAGGESVPGTTVIRRAVTVVP